MFNNIKTVQPDEDGYKLSIAVTSSEDSGRLLDGTMINTPLFVVEAYTLKFSNLKASECAEILRQVVGKSQFLFYHFNQYNCKWENTYFYAANINVSPCSVEEGLEHVDELSFQVTGVNPLSFS